MNLLREYIREILSEQNVLAQGMCFPFAYQKAEEWFEKYYTKGRPGRSAKKHPDLNDKSKFKVVHGTVTNKWKSPSKPVVHGWVEMGDLVFDDQTKVTKPNGVDKEVYYDMYQPEVYKEFTAEEAILNCAMKGGEGPWDDDLYAMMQDRDAWLNEVDLGNKVFAQEAPEGHPHHGDEEDTTVEYEIWLAFYKWIRQNNARGFGHEEMMPAILQAAQDPRYNDVIKMYDGGTVYRGLRIADWDVEKITGLDADQYWQAMRTTSKKRPFKPMSDFVPTNYELHPWGPVKQGFTSWSKNKDAALRFALQTHDDKSTREIGVLLVAEAAAGDFLDMAGLYPYSNFSKVSHEAEVVSIGPVRLTGVYFIQPEKKRFWK